MGIFVIAGGARAAGLRIGAVLGDDLADALGESGGVVGDPVLDGPFNFSGLWDAFGFGVEDAEIGQGIAIDDEEVGEVAGAEVAEVRFLAEHFGIVGGDLLDDLEGVEAGFLMEFEGADEAEPIEVIDEACVFANGDIAPAAGKIADGIHPKAVV